MKRIKVVNVEIIEEDDEQYYSTNLSSPTIDMAIEKMGAFERSRDRQIDPFDEEKEAEDNAREEIGDIIKPAELEADGMLNIEK